MFIGDDYGVQSREGAMSQLVCAECGKPTASARKLAKYHYRESGLENVWLHGGVVESNCADCGNSSIRVWKEAQLLQVIAKALLMEPRPLAGPEWRFIRRAAGMSQAQLASAMKMNRRATIADREGKQHPNLSFPEEVGSRLILLKSFMTYLMTPGNNSLEPSQFEELVGFVGLFRDFAAEVTKPSHRITVAISQDLWTLEEDKHAA
jgi:transcriptional regulator with XRE-family HTH domain